MKNQLLSPTEKQLLEFTRQRDGAIFIGSGVSAWSGIPTWHQLLEHLLARAEQISGPCSDAKRHLLDGRFLDAAEEISKRLTSSEISEILRSDARYSTARPHEIHDLVFAIGSRRFITTNYDCLLEQKAASEGSLLKYRIATHRNVAELADIQKAGADNFIFKLHGDINDAHNIILSRSSYESLLGNKGNSALRALSTIFASRPVLFLGYSISDPDLHLVLSILRDEFQGNAGQRWAIMPTPSKSEIKKLWTDFGIRVVPYSVHQRGPNSDHRELLRILRSIVHQRNLSLTQVDNSTKISRSAIIATALRLAAGFLQSTSKNDFDLRGTLSFHMNQYSKFEYIRELSGKPIHSIIHHSCSDLILQGGPGSGKSSSLKSCAIRLSKQIIADVHAATFSVNTIIPVYLPMQAYSGDLRALISDMTPEGFDVPKFSNQAHILLMLDSIDEIPAEFLGNHLWFHQLETIRSELENVRVVYSTRRVDLIGRSNLPVFNIDVLSDREIENWLENNTQHLRLNFERIWDNLRIPFILTRLQELPLRVGDINSPFRLMKIFIRKKLKDLSDKYDEEELFEFLEQLATDSLSAGKATISIRDFKSACTVYLQDAEYFGADLVDDLVRTGLLSSEINETVRFAHQSIAEFFASSWLSMRWQENCLDVSKFIGTRYWDDALGWALNNLDDAYASGLFLEFANADIRLAIKALLSVDQPTPSLWKVALRALAECELSDDDEYELAYLLEGVDAPPQALNELRKLHACNYDNLSAWALGAMGLHLDDGEMSELLQQISRGAVSEFGARWFTKNLGRRIGSHFQGELKYHLTRSAAAFQKAQSPDSAERLRDGISALSSCIFNFDDHDFRTILPWLSKQHAVLRECFTESFRSDNYWAESHHTRDAIRKFLRLEFDRENKTAWFTIYLETKYRRDYPIFVPNFTDRRLQKILDAILCSQEIVDEEGKSKSRWHIALLHTFCDKRSDWKSGLHDYLKEQKSGKLYNVLLCIHPDSRNEHVAALIQRVFGGETSGLSVLEKAVLSEIDDQELKYTEEVALSLLENDPEAGWEIFRLILPFGIREKLPFLVEELDRWVKISKHLSVNADKNLHSEEIIGSIVVKSLSPTAQRRLIERSQDISDPDRDHILVYYLHYAETILLDDLDRDTALHYLSFYILAEVEPFPSPGGRCSEIFIKRWFLPWVREQQFDKSAIAAIQRILVDAGQAHDKRYFISDTAPGN